jgi:tRNA threonylcarbamoyladenosine biosynthesis protein TsaE
MIVKLRFGVDQINRVAKEQIIPLLKKYSIFTFTGPLGAGKTTLIRSILSQCGILGPVTSPTFGYVNSYQAADGTIYNHFDLYRISMVDEFVMLGFDEYFAKQNSVSFIEWPEVIKSLLENSDFRAKICNIKIDYISDDIESRLIEILWNE